MFKKIQIKNFQSHKESELNFIPGVNIISGASDSGKSAIIRALNWVVNNKPNGESFIKNGEKKTNVLLICDDCEIRRVKSKDENLYKAYFSNKKEFGNITFSAFGQNVPEEIKQVLNISSINIQYQIDNPFLFSLSSGEVSKYLNKIVNIEVIDNSLSNVNKRIKNTVKEIEFNDKNVDKLKDELKQYRWLKRAEKNLKELQADDVINVFINKQIFELNKVLLELYNLKKEKNKLNELLILEHTVNNIVWLIYYIGDKVEEIEKLKVLIKKINDNKQQQAELNIVISLEKEFQEFIYAAEKYEQSQEKFFSFEEIINSIIEIQLEKIKFESIIEVCEEQLPNICPLCGKE